MGSSSESRNIKEKNEQILMSWKPKTWIGSMWIREKGTESGTEFIWGFPSWNSKHSHRVLSLDGSVIYDRVVSGVELSTVGS